MKILIKNGRIWTGYEWRNQDLLIASGIIQAFLEPGELLNSYRDIQVYDVAGAIVVPGFIDMHVHLREPGYEYKETILTGSKAAVKGGFTTIAAMPNTKPITDSVAVVEYIQNSAHTADLARVRPIAAITCNEAGERLTDFAALKAAAVVGFSDDGRGVQSAEIMRAAMQEAAALDLPIMAHCEDEELLAGGVIHTSSIAEELGLPINRSESEYKQIERDILLAAETGAHYHVCHVSTKESVGLIRDAKSSGYKVTAEVTPHHLILNVNDISVPYAQYKVNPPLRTEEDQIALLTGFQDGTIDIISTDHAPHTAEEKARDFLSAPYGFTGLELAFPALYTQLVRNGVITLEELLNKMSLTPASIFKLAGGEIAVGQSADITVIDLETSREVKAEMLVSQGKNTPFNGRRFQGWPIITIVAGDVKWSSIDHTTEGEGVR
jgi:dihydroorotase